MGASAKPRAHRPSRFRADVDRARPARQRCKSPIEPSLALRQEIGIPHRLDAIGVSRDIVPRLAKMAAKDPSCGGNPREVNATILARLYEELLETHGAVENFSSFLRVCCARYLMLQLAGDIPLDQRQPIAGLDAPAILVRERRRQEQQRAEKLATQASEGAADGLAGRCEARAGV